MKAFLAVFAVVLLAFGASIIYYRGDFAGSKGSTKPTNQVVGDSQNVLPANPSNNITQTANAPEDTKVLSETSTTIQYSSLEIKQAFFGNIKVGQRSTFSAYGKDKAGNKSLVPAVWLISDTSLASLDKNNGEEVILTGVKVGKTKLTAAFNNLNAYLNLTVVSIAPVLGANTSNTGSGTTTTGATVYGVGSSAESTQIKPYVIYLYDPNGNRFNIGESRTFTSQVQYNDNSIKTPDLTWSLDPSDLGNLDKTQGSTVNFKANRSGSGSLKATLGNLSVSLYIQVN